MLLLKSCVPAAAIVVAALLAGCSKSAPTSDPIRAVKTVVVGTDSAGGRLDFAGEIRARTESGLSFRVAGKLQQRPVNLGDSVKPGQTLATLDASDLLLGQQAAAAGLASARASLDQARAEVGRAKELRAQGFIGAAELERRQNVLRSAEAQVRQAEAQVEVQSNQARYAKLVSDVGGVVTAVLAEPGMVVAAGLPVLRLAHDGPRDVVFSIPEDKVALIKSLGAAGNSFDVHLWGRDGPPLSARLREVSASADPVTRTFLVKADLPAGAGTAVQLGQTAAVHVVLPQVAGVTKLPLSALREEQGRTTVWIVDPVALTVRAQAVEIAGIDGNEAVIAGGLQAGQRVVTAGVHVLHADQKVRLFAANGAAAVRQPVERPATSAAVDR
ncbi:efflux RND transporter periplasmic adaptor subunit [Piscinibacter sakaiensis]|uniref:efflux RND transporter periplasmic adaptor subunit n=1 Tax=Piscinibacter sakaiensis TaxID=1547922 RepID=UPI003AAAA9C4